MDAKERLYSAATQEFDKCIDKYTGKIKNCLWGMICHAYNEGRKDGLKEAKVKNSDQIRPGDEVFWVSSDGTEYRNNRFIVTEIGEDFISGIQMNGCTHYHDDPEFLQNWKKTGRRFDILGWLKEQAMPYEQPDAGGADD